MKRINQYKLLLLLIFNIIFSSYSQNYYTVKKYNDTVLKDISYGKDTGFAGELVDLKLDIYKPINDSNCNRPILVVVHGGAWMAGDKAGGFLTTLCHDFAKRGYVVASINYRMGFHKTNYYVPYAVCPQDRCIYAYDSAEIIRANYRGMLDAKAAIRFMKARFGKDSTDPNNTYLLGESAGAFISYLTAYLDQDAEKPGVCFKLNDAPLPDADLTSCLPTNPKYARPDLGPIDGRLNLNGMNAKVKAAACFYGGVFETKIFQNVSAVDTPALYIFHQTCDVVVDNNKSKLLSKLYTYCLNPLNLCQPLYTLPPAFGSTYIKNYIDTLSTYKKPTIKYTLLTNGGAYSCDVNSNCHGVDNLTNRNNEVALFFAESIKKTSNKPSLSNCYLTTKKYNSVTDIKLFPNPANTFLFIETNQLNPVNLRLEIYDISSKLISSQTLTNNKIDISKLNSGIYFLKLNNQLLTQKLIIQHD